MDTEAIAQLAVQYKEASEAEKQAKELKGTIKEAILELLADTKSVQVGNWKVTQSTKEPAWRLNEKLLLENGVSPDTIQASKKQDKPSSPSITVTEVKS